MAAVLHFGVEPRQARAQGDEPGGTPSALNLTINGQINSGTAGVEISPGLGVTLHVMRPAESAPLAVTRYQAVSEDAGRFHFEGIPAQTGDLVFASVAFEGVQQSSTLISLGPSPEEFSLPLTVYGITGDPNVIQALEVTHTLDVLPGALQVLSAYQIRNGSDRLYVSEEKTSDGQPVSLRFPLPIGAVGVAFDQQDAFRVSGDAMAPVVQDMRPVRPGELHEVVFSYQLPYSGGAVIDQDYLYHTASVDILIPDDADLRLVGGSPIVSLAPETPRTAQFEARPDATLNPTRPFTRYRLDGQLRPGDRLVFNLEGGAASSPVPGAGADSQSDSTTILAIAIGAVALIGVVVLGALLVRRAPGTRP
jgi:hypothetical protein